MIGDKKWGGFARPLGNIPVSLQLSDHLTNQQSVVDLNVAPMFYLENTVT